MINPDSIKAKLKNEAKLSGHMLQEKLTAYGLERTIYRISISDFVDNFTLKGGILLYALFAGDFTRVTTDIDLLAQRINNEMGNIKTIFEEIFSIELDDALFYDLKSLEIKAINEFKLYHGVNVSIIAYLDRTKIPISIDIGFGDTIYPQKILINFPSILDMEISKIYAYTLYSVIAEKFEAIVDLGYANSRYKDFYDLYILASSYDFKGSELKRALEETFNHRQTGLNDIVAFENSFKEDLIRQVRWNSFTKKKKAITNIGFDDVVNLITVFLKPVVKSIITGDEMNYIWDSKKKVWN